MQGGNAVTFLFQAPSGLITPLIQLRGIPSRCWAGGAIKLYDEKYDLSSWEQDLELIRVNSVRLDLLGVCGPKRTADTAANVQHTLHR